MVKDAGLRILRANPYMDRKRYYFFSLLDWIWNRRSRPEGGRWGDHLQALLAEKEWMQRRLHSWLKALMKSRRDYGAGGAGMVLLACKTKANLSGDPSPYRRMGAEAPPGVEWAGNFPSALRE